ncbi:hypothetical protein [Oceanicoccus sp. KOV_DT_Chl]|uniref:hypothetical protein n=1 Tax=Oceanicoccus sp. KOV_DT_Chl TaxID=1904639 RepID=UPI000C799DA6|nr:hypothetical protein [Oceanicoccus sp. KOV_DT_Chl]
MTPNALCLSADNNEKNIQRLREISHQRLDLWLDWVDQAVPVPLEKQAAVSERDLMVRRTVAEVDPANVVGETLFGKALCERLVTTLWGGNRQLPRAIDM